MQQQTACCTGPGGGTCRRDTAPLLLLGPEPPPGKTTKSANPVDCPCGLWYLKKPWISLLFVVFLENYEDFMQNYCRKKNQNHAVCRLNDLKGKQRQKQMQISL